MTSPRHDRLMLLHDDELGVEEAEELSQRIAGDAEAAGVLRGMEQVGSLLREAADARGAGADDIALRVMACIDAESAAPGGQALPPPAEAGNARLVPLQRRWRHALPVATGMLALAAAAVLLVRSGTLAHHPVVDSPASATAQAMQPTQAVKGPAALAPKPEAKAHAADSPSVAIETVDFGSHDGAIFMVSAGHDSTPVVWLTDEPAAHGGKTEPL